MALPPKARKGVRAAVDYGGLAAFLVGYLLTRDLVQATWWLVGGSAAALTLGLILERRLAPMPAVAGGAALFFGILTLVFHDAVFIKIKATAINLILGVVLIGGVALKRNPLKALLGEATFLPDAVWRTLAVRFGLYYLVCAGLNEVVWRTLPLTHLAAAHHWTWLPLKGDDEWVFFRFPGLQILAVLFTMTQLPMMLKHADPGEAGSKPAD